MNRSSSIELRPTLGASIYAVKEEKTQTKRKKKKQEKLSWIEITFPFRILLISLTNAWIYTMIPNENYWMYNCFKQQLWAFLSLVAYIELQDICLPDLPDHLYISCFFIGFCTPLIVNSIAYFFEL
jgi:hypothetical protein